MVKKLLERLTKKNWKQILNLQMLYRKKVINYMSNNRKAIIILLIIELIKKISILKMSYFSESHIHTKTNQNLN